MLGDLLRLSPATRREVLGDLSDTDMAALLRAAELELGSPYAIWQGDPLGFAAIIGEALWSMQRRILESLVDNRATAVPSCFASSKTRSAALAAAYWVAVHPPGTATVVTIAPRWRQVARQIWPEIRGVHTRGQLPGAIDMTQWKVDAAGSAYVAAYGIAAPHHDESSVQGIHAPNLLLILDEAGGIGPVIGRNLAALLTGGNARMLAIGNPPTDEEGSWFEQFCEGDRPHVIPIAAEATPNFTGERTPRCTSCPPAVPAHRLAIHLIDRQWVADAEADTGVDSRYVTAKVHARFPRGGPNTLIPAAWTDAAVDSDEPELEPGVLRLDDLGLPEERAAWAVRQAAWVRLGVDVAADGGDELVVARAVGDLVTVEHTSAGAANASAVDVAGVVLREIRRAEALRQRLGTPQRVRVKVDAIGVGYGVVGLLEAWRAEGLHDAEVVRVNVAEGIEPGRVREPSTLRPARKRDELWLATRALLMPDPRGGPAGLRLRVDRRTAAQLSAPRYSTNTHGQTVVESKKSMRKRGLRSPDRAEGCLLAVYEPGNRQTSIIV
jgi:hypothetical protein